MVSVLVVSYDPARQKVMTVALQDFGINVFSCSLFAEAAGYALLNQVSGVIVDVATMIRAKDDEQSVSTFLQNVYPLLRVRVSDSGITPMFVGKNDTQQQGALAYIQEVCAGFAPRTLRRYKRRISYLPVVMRNADGKECQTITIDLSWGGAFIALNELWGLEVGEKFLVHMPTLGISREAQLVRIVPWGVQNVIPGLGVTWADALEQDIEEALLTVLRYDKTNSRDTIVG